MLSTLLFFLSLFSMEVRNRKIKVEKDYKEIKEKYDKVTSIEESYYSFYPGKKALIYGYGLVQKATDTNFKVNYEVEILDVSTNKVKVKAFDFTSDDDIGNEPSLKNSIINFIENKWVDKKYVEPLLDEESIRDKKLNEILND